MCPPTSPTRVIGIHIPDTLSGDHSTIDLSTDAVITHAGWAPEEQPGARALAAVGGTKRAWSHVNKAETAKVRPSLSDTRLVDVKPRHQDGQSGTAGTATNR